MQFFPILIRAFQLWKKPVANEILSHALSQFSNLFMTEIRPWIEDVLDHTFAKKIDTFDFVIDFISHSSSIVSRVYGDI